MKKRQSKKWINVLLLILVTALVLYFSLKDDFTQIIDQILSVNLIWLLVALLFIFIYWAFRAASLHQFAIQFKADYSLKKAFHLTLVTQFFHAVTPFASGGQPYEIYTLKKEGLSLADSSNVSIQGFIVYQLALVLLGLMAILTNQFFHLFEGSTFLRQLVFIGFTVNMTVIVFLFLFAFAERFNKFVVRLIVYLCDYFHLIKDTEAVLQRWQKRVTDFHQGAVILIKNKKLFLKTIGINFLALLCLYLIPLLVLFSLRDYHSFNVIGSISACAYVMLIGSFVPLPGGTGGLEFAFIEFFGGFVGGSTLKALMLLWRFITYYFGMFVGAIAFNVKGDKQK